MKRIILKQPEVNKKFISLKFKWSIATGLGVVLIFAVFFILLYQSFSALLLQQEENYAHNAVDTAVARLENYQAELTVADVKKVLNYETAVDKNTEGIYSDAVFSTLSRKYLGVSVYNISGDLIFASRDVPVRFTKALLDNDTLTKESGQSIFVTSRQVRSRLTHQVIGYVQVTNRLHDYDKTRGKLLLIFFVFGITAGVAAALLSYGLSSWFLRPIDTLNETIGKINNDEKGNALSYVRVPEFRTHDELADLGTLFNSMLDRMERNILQQQQFVEDVSHELRTPVAIIQGHLNMLNRWGKDDPKVLNDSIEASLQEIERMKSLVQEMLDLSRAEQVEIQFANETTDIQSIGLQVFENFKLIHPEFVFLMDDDLKGPTFVQIYRNHLEQVLIILLDNAVKYSRERKEIQISMAKNERFVEIVVQDFGQGIAKEDITRVFDRFYRVDKSRSREQGGNGLGLAIAKRLIAGYHGDLTVESVFGQGSIFKITLPLLNMNKEND